MKANAKKPLVARKLLVAAVGVATVNYVAVVSCGGQTTQGSSLSDGGADGPTPTSGNLVAKPPPDADPPPTSGNLPAPPPPDGGSDADADADIGDADDAG